MAMEQPINETCMHRKECGELFAGLNTWLMETLQRSRRLPFLPMVTITAGAKPWRIVQQAGCAMCSGRALPSRQGGYRIHNLHRHMSSCSPMQKEIMSLITDIPVATAYWIHYRVCEEIIWKIFMTALSSAVTCKDAVVWKWWELRKLRKHGDIWPFLFSIRIPGGCKGDKGWDRPYRENSKQKRVALLLMVNGQLY